MAAAVDIAGRGVGGALVAVLTAPFAWACSSAAYLASALRLTGIRAAPAPLATARSRPGSGRASSTYWATPNCGP